MGATLLALLGMGVMAGVNWLNTWRFAAPAKIPSDDIHGAWVYGQMFVKKRLKSPSTASFPFGGASKHVTPLGGGRYQVDAYVDSQNGFGAMLRTHFHLVIKQVAGGWEQESLKFRDR